MGALTNLLTGVNLGTTANSEVAKTQRRTKNGDAFAGVLERTEKQEVKQPMREDNRKEQTKPEKAQKSETQAAESSKPVAVKDAPQAERVEKPAEAADIPAKEVNKKLMAALSKALDVPEDVIAQILAQLNMQALDLYKPENLSLFMQKLTGVETKEQLLGVPDIQTMFKQINKALDAFTAEAKSIATAQAEAKPVQDAPKELTPAKPSAEQKQDAVQLTDTAKEFTAAEAKPEQAVKPAQAETGTENEATQDNTPKEQIRTAQEFNPAAAPITAQQVEQSAVRTESVRNIDTQSVIDQIVDKMKVEVKGDLSEIKIQLKPEHLGDVSLKITTQNGIVTAQFVAENQRIREIIEASFNQLRDSLAQQGIQLSQLSVSVGNNQNEQQTLYERERNVSGRRVEAVAAGILAEEEELALDSEGETLTDASVNYLA